MHTSSQMHRVLTLGPYGPYATGMEQPRYHRHCARRQAQCQALEQAQAAQGCANSARPGSGPTLSPTRCAMIAVCRSAGVKVAPTPSKSPMNARERRSHPLPGPRPAPSIAASRPDPSARSRDSHRTMLSARSARAGWGLVAGIAKTGPRTALAMSQPTCCVHTTYADRYQVCLSVNLRWATRVTLIY